MKNKKESHDLQDSTELGTLAAALTQRDGGPDEYSGEVNGYPVTIYKDQTDPNAEPAWVCRITLVDSDRYEDVETIEDTAATLEQALGLTVEMLTAVGAFKE